jgi:hypothetical protein
MESFSLTDDLSQQWQNATQLRDLIKQADGVLSRRHLRLFRASCCATLLSFVDEPLCNAAVTALERLAEDRMTYHEHNECVLRMLDEPVDRLWTEFAEARQRRDFWIRPDFPEVFAHGQRLQARPPEYDPDLLVFNEWEYGTLRQRFRELLDGHTLINSAHLSVKANTHRLAVIECIRDASVSVSGWELQDEIAATLRREPELARVRVEAIYPWPEFPPVWREHYQLLHCHTFREIVPGPEDDDELVQPWRQPAVLDIAREIDVLRDFLQMWRLADALEDAGCEDTAVLMHCLRSDPTIRGSWLVDLLLGRQ